MFSFLFLAKSFLFAFVDAQNQLNSTLISVAHSSQKRD